MKAISKYVKFNDSIDELSKTIAEHMYIAQAIKAKHPEVNLNGLRFYISDYLKNKGEVPQVSVSDIIQAKQEREQRKVIANNETQLIDHVQYLENELRLLQQVKNYTPEQLAIHTVNKGSKGEATAIIQYSDWHVDEVVDGKTVNGMNNYNPEIVRKRAEKLFINSVKLTDTQRHDIKIPHLVLQLGGDFIGGFIHPELEQTNSMTPVEGVLFSKTLLTNGINYLLKNGGFTSITIVCNMGNHGRLTKKMQYANGYSTNLELFLYQSLADEFKSDKRLKFVVPESEIAYIDVYGKTLRFFHGHQVKYMGGVGGLTVPLHKQLYRWNANKMAYYNFMCDKHTYSTPTPDCQVNGSLKGYDAFAAGHGFLYQEPLQSFTLLDSVRGITIKSKIFCE